MAIPNLLAEFEFNNLLFRYSANHSQTRAVQTVVGQARESYNQVLQGQERIMPIAQDSLPEVGFEFADLRRKTITLTNLIEFVSPVLEETRLTEERTAKSVQVLDPAIPAT